MNKINFMLLMVVVLLACIGLIVVYSASSAYAMDRFGSSYYFFHRQLLWLFVGGMGLIFTYNLPYKKWKAASKPLIMVSILLLLMTISPLGRQAGGAKRWIGFGGFLLQPAEIVKLFFVIYIADFLSRKKVKIKSFFQGLCPPLFLLSVVVVILLLQPDFGTAVLIAVLTFILFFVGGGSLVYLFSLFFLSLPIAYYLVFNVGYRRERVMTILNPYKDPQGAGFQLIQSIIAIGSGRIFGKGIGASKQKLFFLPSSYNDFIFSIIAEELGFIGATTIILLFVVFVILGFRIVLKAREAKDDFAVLLALGIILLISIQAFINIGVSTGILPTKGLCLPFVSYGGSSLVVSLTSVGILLNIGKSR
ncbi:putative lipid II flippase FtsW [bacterium]|nr:putative lipid II flippase FtsW [bacterium]